MKRQGLPAKERIKNKKEFEILYSTGSSIYSTNKTIKAIYLIKKKASISEVKMVAVAGKKQGGAVWRNRIRRLIKESYRLNKEIFLQESLTKEVSIKIIFSPYSLTERENKILKLKDIMPGVVDVMLKIKSWL